MRYERASESMRVKIKKLAYKWYPEIWESYSGKPKAHKQYIESKRVRALSICTNVVYKQAYG